MLSSILLPYLRRTFSTADRYSWLSFTFDKDKEVVTLRQGRSAKLDRLSFLTYLIHVAHQAYGILWRLWHNSGSSDVTQIISAMFCLSYVVTLVIGLYWEADQGVPPLLNVITKRSTGQEAANGEVEDYR